MHSNNPLAVKLETENDAACENLPPTFSSIIEAAAQAAPTIRTSSNDQHVET
jgi:hypothetical protein